MIPVGVSQEDQTDVRRLNAGCVQPGKESPTLPRLTGVQGDGALGFEHVARVEPQVDGEDLRGH